MLKELLLLIAIAENNANVTKLHAALINDNMVTILFTEVVVQFFVHCSVVALANKLISINMMTSNIIEIATNTINTISIGEISVDFPINILTINPICC